MHTFTLITANMHLVLEDATYTERGAYHSGAPGYGTVSGRIKSGHVLNRIGAHMRITHLKPGTTHQTIIRVPKDAFDAGRFEHTGV